MRRFIIAVSVPLVLTVILVALKYAAFPRISLFWAFSPLWLGAVSALLVFYGVWANIALQRWLMVHGRKKCGNCLHCSIADIRPGRKLCLVDMKEVEKSQKGCDKWETAVMPKIK